MDINGFDNVSASCYRHSATGVAFTLVDADDFTMGMTDAEEQMLRRRREDIESDVVVHFIEEYLRQARPAVHVHVGPFLIADFPLTVRFVTSRWGFAEDQFSDDGAAYLPDADTIGPLISELGFRLPSEAEWEYCHRRFHPLQDLPGEDSLQLTPIDGIAAFGSYAELCADAWSPTLDDIPRDGSPRIGDGPRSVRGGAANLYPWQGCGEWLGLLPFTRYSENQGDLLSVRPAVSVVQRA